MATGIVRPNGDITRQWRPTTVAAYSRVNEAITQPTAGNAVAVSCYPADGAGKIDSFNVGTISPITVVTAVQLWSYMKTTYNAFGVIHNVYLGGWLGGTILRCNVSNVYSWESKTWSGLNKTQADLNAMQIKITTVDPAGTNYSVVDTLYAVITYTYTPPGWYHKINTVNTPAKVNSVLKANIGKIMDID